MEVKVPSFYKDFHCKCGACRHTCCHGWKITLSYIEYCRLLGLSCSAALRRKLDTAFYILDDRNDERYAAMNLNYFGNCPLLDANGFCSLQKECGEDVLPLICRLYPRNIVYCAMDEGALSNSCEGVIELLVNRTEPFQITSIDSPYSKDIHVSDEDRKIQQKTFEILSDRTISLEERLVALEKNLGFIFDEKKMYPDEETFSILLHIIAEIEKHSPLFKEFAVFAEEDLQILQEKYDYNFVSQRYTEAKKSFTEHFPNYEIIFEELRQRILVTSVVG